MPRLLEEQSVKIGGAGATVDADLNVPDAAAGLVIFAHGSGSGRHSPRNRFVAGVLQKRGLATLLLDLLTRDEDEADRWDGRYRFDIDLLKDRLIGATDWALTHPSTRGLAIGYFGASTGAAAALKAAVERPNAIRAVVSRGGRVDMAEEALDRAVAPALFIVGGNDGPVIELNEQAIRRIPAKEKQLVIVPDATHLFEEPAALERVADLAAGWLDRHLNRGERGLP